ncbi:hypothetical protein [Pseudomonas grandcourensis]|uniref:hypothetical protein n=1 Tax=Pseudomonas grandcourensis TaxID=3136736 RepID=UPI0032645B53
MHLTKHAAQRSQQRGINQDQLDWLLTYGKVGRNKGVNVYFFDRAGFEQLIHEVGPDHQTLAQRSRGIFAVVADDNVITLGYRDERLKPKKPHRRIRRGTPLNPAARRIHHRTEE